MCLYCGIKYDHKNTNLFKKYFIGTTKTNNLFNLQKSVKSMVCVLRPVYSQCSGVISSVSLISRPHLAFYFDASTNIGYCKYCILFLSSNFPPALFSSFLISRLFSYSSLTEQEMFPFNVSGYINI